MKLIIRWSLLSAGVFLVGCDRAAKDTSAGTAGSNQPIAIEPGAIASESEDWGYLGLKIIKAHEKQSFVEKSPWHAPGGDWTFLECAVGKNPSSQVLIGTRSRGSTKGDLPISWGEGVIAVTDNNAGIAFVEAFAKAFHQSAPPRYGTNPIGYVKVNTAVLGQN